MLDEVAPRALGSALGDALLDVDRGRVDVHVPPHAPGERLPGVVFLHGSAGSWKGYFRLWSQLADRERFVLVQPSFGFGNWQRPGGLAAIARARRYLVEHTPCDPERVALACLSSRAERAGRARRGPLPGLHAPRAGLRRGGLLAPRGAVAVTAARPNAGCARGTGLSSRVIR